MSDSVPVEKTVISVKERTKVHRGPIPSPEAIKQYEEVLPGLADRIVAMAERNQKNMHVEYMVPLLLAFAMFALLIVGSFALALLGQSKVAVAFLSPAVLGIIGALLVWRHRMSE